MSKRIAVYTAVFGDYSGLIPQPKLKDVDFICYTDQNIQAKNWTIVKVKPPVKNDNTRSNRWYKILPHKHLPKTYDYSVYIDANFWILKDINPLINDIMKHSKLAFFDHNQTNADKRDCVYDEYEAILEIARERNEHKDDPDIMKSQIDTYKEEGYPENNGLISGGIIIRKHFDEEVVKLMESWWTMVANHSKRDQLSFNYVAWKLNFHEFSYIDGDIRRNEWFRLISHRKNYAFKMLKIKLNRFFKPKTR